MDKTWIQTNSGKRFWPLSPRVEDVDIVDIAHVVSHKGRFGCQLDKPFTIGHHILIVSRLVPREFALEGLLHDGNEGYLPDIPNPIKPMLPWWKQIEDNVDEVVFKRYRLLYPMNEKTKWNIKRIDWVSAFIEHELFFKHNVPWDESVLKEYDINLNEYDRQLWINMQKLSPEDTKNLILRTFKDLVRERFGADCLYDFFDKPQLVVIDPQVLPGQKMI